PESRSEEMTLDKACRLRAWTHQKLDSHRESERHAGGNPVTSTMSEINYEARHIFRRWVLATWGGWVLGVPLIAGLALIGEAVGVGGAQFIVGMGMGAGVGLMQARIMRRVLPKTAPWFWSCAVGLGVPFLVADIAKAAAWNYTYSLHISVALGG